jgi:integrase
LAEEFHGKKAVIRFAPRTARAIDLTIGDRCEGPIFATPAGQRLDRHGAGRIVRQIARRAGLAKKIGPHTLRHAIITAALDAGVPLQSETGTRSAGGRSISAAQNLPNTARCGTMGFCLVA